MQRVCDGNQISLPTQRNDCAAGDRREKKTHRVFDHGRLPAIPAKDSTAEAAKAFSAVGDVAFTDALGLGATVTPPCDFVAKHIADNRIQLSLCVEFSALKSQNRARMLNKELALRTLLRCCHLAHEATAARPMRGALQARRFRGV